LQPIARPAAYLACPAAYPVHPVAYPSRLISNLPYCMYYIPSKQQEYVYIEIFRESALKV
jgi:hypothetical protein